MSNEFEQLGNAIGERVRRFRHSLRLSQTEAARRAKLSVDTWSRLERGAAQNHTLATLFQVASALEVGVGALFPKDQETESSAVQELLELVEILDEETMQSLVTTVRLLCKIGR